MTKMQLSAAVICLAASPALGAETIEAIGGEKCGRTSKAYAVDFLAPDDAQVEARGKGMLGNSEEAKADDFLSGSRGLTPRGKPRRFEDSRRGFLIAATHASVRALPRQP